MKIAFFDAKPYDTAFFEKSGKEHGIQYKFFETKLCEDTADLARGYDGVCVFVNDNVDAAVIEKLHKNGVKVIALRCAGFNNVDVKSAFGKIHVVRVPAYSPNAVAEHAIAMLLTSIRRIHKAYNRTKDFNFSLSGLTGFELYGKTVGIIGTGKIGNVFASICKGFGMTILGYDKYESKEFPGEYVALERLLSESDIVSLHCPLTEQTEYMICNDSIEKMKKGVVIINTSRGGLIDTEALLEGIKARKIGAACLDVYEEESDIFFEDRSGHIIEDDTLARLISMPNVIVTSHQAFLTQEALASIADTTSQNIITFFDSGRCDNELCYRCGKIEDCKKSRCEKCF